MNVMWVIMQRRRDRVVYADLHKVRWSGEGPGDGVYFLTEEGAQAALAGLPAEEHDWWHVVELVADLPAAIQIAERPAAAESGPRCPWCGSKDLDAEFVDIGVGTEQVTPYTCMDCWAVQVNPWHGTEGLTAVEERMGWHCPDRTRQRPAAVEEPAPSPEPAPWGGLRSASQPSDSETLERVAPGEEGDCK